MVQAEAIRLKEYRLTLGVRLTVEEVAELRRLCRSLSISPTAAQPGHFDLRPGSEVGVIRLGERIVEIQPKIPIDRIMFLVSYAVDPKAWRDQLLPLSEVSSLVEALIPGFVLQLKRALARGVLHGYRAQEEALQTIRGRLRIEDQLRRRFGRFPPAEVRFDDFTVDIDENRLLRAAISRLLRLRLRNDDLRQSLRQFEALLSEVPLVDYDARNLPQVGFTALNQPYRPAVDLATLILRGCSFELYEGAVRSSAFLIDMNTVFEDFVVVALRETLNLGERSLLQGCKGRPLYLGTDARIHLKPDLSWWEGHSCVFVGDVKYKRTEAQGVLHPDLYQLLAYAVATDLEAGLLIYAAGEGEPTSHSVRYLDKRLHVAVLDVQGEPAEILEQVASIAGMVRGLRASGATGSRPGQAA